MQALEKLKRDRELLIKQLELTDLAIKSLERTSLLMSLESLGLAVRKLRITETCGELSIQLSKDEAWGMLGDVMPRGTIGVEIHQDR